MSDFLSSVVCVSAIDPNGKKFDRVSRLVGKSIDNDVSIELDYNCDILNVKVADELSLFLSFNESTPQFADISYGMNGKLFKIDDSGSKSTFYISFGGLLLKIEFPSNLMSKVKSGSTCRLYLRKK